MKIETCRGVIIILLLQTAILTFHKEYNCVFKKKFDFFFQTALTAFTSTSTSLLTPPRTPPTLYLLSIHAVLIFPWYNRRKLLKSCCIHTYTHTRLYRTKFLKYTHIIKPILIFTRCRHTVLPCREENLYIFPFPFLYLDWKQWLMFSNIKRTGLRRKKTKIFRFLGDLSIFFLPVGWIFWYYVEAFLRKWLWVRGFSPPPLRHRRCNV